MEDGDKSRAKHIMKEQGCRYRSGRALVFR